MFAALWSKEVKINISLVSMHIKYILAAGVPLTKNAIADNQRCYIFNSVPECYGKKELGGNVKISSSGIIIHSHRYNTQGRQ